MSNTAVNFYCFFYNLLSAFKSNFTLVVGGHYTSRKKHLYFVVSDHRRQMLCLRVWTTSVPLDHSFTGSHQNPHSVPDMSKICQRLVSIILTGADLTFLRAGECRDNFTVAVHFYVKMRVFYAVKFFNTSLAERPRNKRNRKALILEHL